MNASTLTELAKYDTPTVCNVIELFDVRPRHVGYMNGAIQACFPKLPPMVGFALTSTFRSYAPPPAGGSYGGLIEQVEKFAECAGPPVMDGAAKLGVELWIASPKGFEPKARIVSAAAKFAKASGARVIIVNDPVEAVRGASIVYTDVWASMGQEAETEDRAAVFADYQVDKELMSHARKEAVFMHCLPAHRGYEVAPSVIDSRQSIVYDEAENRLHVQKAILYLLMK